MKNTNKKQLDSALKSLIDRLEKTEKFVLGELPELCQQIVNEKIMREKMDVISSGIGTVMLSVTAILLAMTCHHYCSVVEPVTTYGASNKDIAAFFCGAGSVVAVFLAIFATGSYCIASIQNLLSVKVAPKLYILKQLRNLIS